jgi:hydroxyacylglutathione hydrolase
MTLSIRAFPSGLADTNAYLVVDPETNRALIVDAPRDVTETLVAALDGATVDRIVITHTHWDHIGDAAALKARFGAPIAAHPLAVDGLTKPGSALTRLPYEIAPAPPDELLEDGNVVELGAHRFAVMHLPGHEPAHIVLYSEPDKVVLGGDVLFPNGHGRIDIPGSDQRTMNRSLARLADLPADVTVYPGHGDPTTIGRESWIKDLRG